MRSYNRHHSPKKPTNNPFSSNKVANKILSIVKKKFFSFDERELQLFADFYGGIYGDGARKYLITNFNKWKSGIITQSSGTISRILHCVPKFMSVEEQFGILKLYIPLLYEKAIKGVDSKTTKLSFNISHQEQWIDVKDVNNYFGKVYNSIISADLDLDWFIKEAFTAEELKDLANIVKYVLIQDIKLVHVGTCDDFALISSHLNTSDDLFELSYTIDLLKIHINIETLPIKINPIMPEVKLPAMAIKYEKYFKEVLLNHSLEYLKKEKEGDIKQAIVSNDIMMVLDNISKYKDNFNVDAIITAQGKGGSLSAHLVRKNKTELWGKAISSLIVALGITLLYIGIIFGVLAIKGKDALSIIILGTFATIAIPIGFWSDYFTKIKEIREYEQGRQKFTKSL